MTACAADTDQRLFFLLSQGDEQAFEVFFFRYNTKVYHFILHLVKQESLAEELTQDIFLKLWLGRAMLGSVLNPGNYLFVMAKNRSLDQLSLDARSRVLQQTLLRREPVYADSPEDGISYRESCELIATAVGELSEQQRTIYHLSKEQGLSRNQIASILHISPHTVKNHLGMALDTIRRHLHRHGKMAGVLLFWYLQ